MPQIVFASANAHKKAEMQRILEGNYTVLDLHDIGCTTDIPETADTFEGNAALKSGYVLENYGLDCFADDSGLQISALNMEPGVFSARYAGGRDPLQNLTLVLEKMKGVTDRRAQFKTVISLRFKDGHFLFEGIVKGTIAEQASGSAGFGYDPIFIPNGYDKTFAALPAAVKDSISHRAVATRKMVEFLVDQLAKPF